MPPAPEDDSLEKSLSDEATFAGRVRDGRSGASLGDERTFGGGDAAGVDTILDDIEIVDLETRYKVEGTLGEGGMGAVVLATDTRLGRKVAIKRILGEAARSKAAIARFLTEARAIAAISHPNVVQIYELGVARDGPFLIIEYVEGGSLLDRCKAAPLAADEAVRLICQVCDGLGRAHELGIIHRDIKPANVLLTKNGTPKLTDFGLAKAEAADHQMTMTGAVMGTPDFMPPEQRRDAAFVDHRSDLWSLGATLYQAVTGKSPKVIRLHELPVDLQPILSKALEDDKDARYQSAKEFRDALRAAAGADRVTQSRTAVADELEEGRCTACGTLNSDLGRNFCRKCAAPLRVACPRCAAQMPVWDAICGQCGGDRQQLSMAAARVAEAVKHVAVWDYLTAIRSLESIPEAARSDEATAMLTDCRERHEESSRLIAEIAERVKQKQIDGLLPLVERAVELRRDRQDLVKIQGQLRERRDGLVARARAAFEAGDVKAADAFLAGTVASDLDPAGVHLLEHVRRLADLECEIVSRVKEAKADGVVTPQEAAAIIEIGEAYLRLQPGNEKVKTLVSRCREIAKPPVIRNSIGIELKLLPPGRFTMGQAGGDSDETAHQVTLTKPFYIGVYEVTNAQWQRVMGSVPSTWKGDDHPVEQVSWEEAVDFCQKLSALPAEREAGRVYRLPTEAEWEYACRAGSTTKWSFGEDESRLGDYAWFDGNSGGQTHPVGKKKPNAWGLFDMHGNVWEWCSDWYGDYAKGSVTDPTGPWSASARVSRGGGWLNPARRCRSASRRWFARSLRLYDLGFRLALSPSGARPVPPEAATGR